MKRVINAPTHVQLFLTKGCNLRCEHCFAEQFATDAHETELTTCEWKSLITELREAGVFSLLFSGGELYTKKDASEILSHAARLGFPKIRVSTNGTLITARVARCLREDRISSVLVSVDGVEATHDEIRGLRGAFRKALRGLEHLLDNDIATSIAFTAMRKNSGELQAVAELALSLGVKAIVVQKLRQVGRCGADRYSGMCLRLDESRRFTALVSDTRQDFPDLRISYSPPAYENLQARGSWPAGDAQCLKPCGAADLECAIMPAGQVIPCCFLADFDAGSVRDERFLDIWRHSRVLEQVRNLSQVTMDQVPFCKDCAHNTVCSAGCRGDAYSMLGSLLAPDPNCPLWQQGVGRSRSASNALSLTSTPDGA